MFGGASSSKRPVRESSAGAKGGPGKKQKVREDAPLCIPAQALQATRTKRTPFRMGTQCTHPNCGDEECETKSASKRKKSRPPTQASPLQPVEFPSPMLGQEKTLRPYQKDFYDKCLSYMKFKGKGFLLADEMGLGKTAQSLAVLSYLQQMYQDNPSVIVAPLATLKQWKEAAGEWCPHLLLQSVESSDDLAFLAEKERGNPQYVKLF